MRASAVIALVAGALALSWCATTGASRRGPGGACVSGRDCLYGLLCVAGAEGASRTCQYEQWGECATNDDCLSGHLCRDGVCTVECATNRECDAGTCLAGECAAPAERECVLPGDCGMGYDCVAGHCEPRMQLRCFSDLDCRSGESCFGGWCR